jgi:hypothetical protein
MAWECERVFQVLYGRESGSFAPLLFATLSGLSTVTRYAPTDVETVQNVYLFALSRLA